MSYEGYVVYYCKNGHRLGTKDAYEEDVPEGCDICGEKDYVFDSVDQTNGCECRDNTCAAHEKIIEKDVVKYDPIKCHKCDGLGYIAASNYSISSCCSDPKCELCYGTGKKYELQDSEEAINPCPICKGRGKVFVKVYDLSKLIHKYGT